MKNIKAYMVIDAKGEPAGNSWQDSWTKILRVDAEDVAMYLDIIERQEPPEDKRGPHTVIEVEIREIMK